MSWSLSLSLSLSLPSRRLNIKPGSDHTAHVAKVASGCYQLLMKEEELTVVADQLPLEDEKPTELTMIVELLRLLLH